MNVHKVTIQVRDDLHKTYYNLENFSKSMVGCIGV